MADVDQRRKNANWIVSGDDGRAKSIEHVAVAVLMDIRDELQTLVRLANCYRIPRALDACIELGAEARRRKKNTAKRRKAARK